VIDTDSIPLEVPPEAEGTRTLAWVAERLGISKPAAQRLLDRRGVTRFGLPAWAFARVRAGDVLMANPSLVTLPPAVDAPLDVVHEDDDVLVIAKPRGLSVHPASPTSPPSLVQMLMARHPELQEWASLPWPGIVHRLDRDTSGLMVCARTEAAAAHLIGQFERREVVKRYEAVVNGQVHDEEGKVSEPLRRAKGRILKMRIHPDGQTALTEYAVLERFVDATLLSLRLHTGRTHQIRVHMKHIGHPLVGDRLYGAGPTEQIQGQALHAAGLSFRHPRSGAWMSFTLPRPADMEALCVEARRGPVAPPPRPRKPRQEPPPPMPADEKARRRALHAEIFVQGRNRAAEYLERLAGRPLTVALRNGTRRVGEVHDEEPYRLRLVEDGVSHPLDKIDVAWVGVDDTVPRVPDGTFEPASIGRLVAACSRDIPVRLRTREGETMQARIAWMDRWCLGLEGADGSVTLWYRHALEGVEGGNEAVLDRVPGAGVSRVPGSG
jgi:23S rRNA pseudouridine1911/1915/1917 synthase